MVKISSPRYLRPLLLTTGVNLSFLKALRMGCSNSLCSSPYSSWERAQNERHNRLFRRYVSKGVSIENYTDEQIMWFADEMNDMPMRQLGYSTPAELFDEFFDQVYSVIKVRLA